MAFNPRTDVILEVASAADPSRATVAAQRLSALAGSNAPAADFAADLDRAAGAASATAPPLASAGDSAAQMSANILSAPTAAELDDGGVLFAGRKRT